jgi:hypothetical protein
MESNVGFLLGELIKRQKLDDRNAQVAGFCTKPDGMVYPGAAVNSQDGFIVRYYHRGFKKKVSLLLISVFQQNAFIVDYIEQMINLIPEAVSNSHKQNTTRGQILFLYHSQAYFRKTPT